MVAVVPQKASQTRKSYPINLTYYGGYANKSLIHRQRWHQWNLTALMSSKGVVCVWGGWADVENENLINNGYVKTSCQGWDTGWRCWSGEKKKRARWGSKMWRSVCERQKEIKEGHKEAGWSWSSSRGKAKKRWVEVKKGTLIWVDCQWEREGS